jgi:uncharacterized protein (TIGR03083 family)
VDNAELYREGRARIGALVRDLDDAAAATAVPASPAWTVADVIRHMAGIAADVSNGNVGGAGTEPWTDAQVAARKETSISDLLAEWDHDAPDVEGLLGAVPAATGLRVIADMVTHEHDLRGALGAPGERESGGVDAAVQTYVMGLDARLKGNALGPLRLLAGSQEWVIGEGDGDSEPVATLRTEPFELFRSLSGRRSRTQVEDLEWDGAPAHFIDHFPQYAFPATDLVE